eukprot:g34401.t1
MVNGNISAIAALRLHASANIASFSLEFEYITPSFARAGGASREPKSNLVLNLLQKSGCHDGIPASGRGRPDRRHFQCGSSPSFVPTGNRLYEDEEGSYNFKAPARGGASGCDSRTADSSSGGWHPVVKYHFPAYWVHTASGLEIFIILLLHSCQTKRAKRERARTWSTICGQGR